MKKLVILFFALALLLAGCVEDETLVGGLPAEFSDPTEIPSQATQEATQEATLPPELGTCYLKEQVYYDALGSQLAKMNVSLNDSGLPETVFMDSGKDVTHTVFYDEQGVITGFQQVESLYGEDTTTIYQTNAQGDITQYTTNAGTDKEATVEYALVYNDEGYMTQKDVTKKGAVTSTETHQYDRDGKLLVTEVVADNKITKTVYTYENSLLVKTEQSVNGIVNQTVTYTYDDSGKLIEKRTSGQITSYTYRANGVLKQISVLRGSSQQIGECDEYGRISVQYNYTDGQATSKIVYVWQEFENEPTDAQLKIFDQLGIIESIF